MRSNLRSLASDARVDRRRDCCCFSRVMLEISRVSLHAGYDGIDQCPHSFYFKNIVQFVCFNYVNMNRQEDIN